MSFILGIIFTIILEIFIIVKYGKKISHWFFKKRIEKSLNDLEKMQKDFFDGNIDNDDFEA